MTESAHHKLPRLYLDAPLSAGGDIPLDPAQAHYLGTVLRRRPGDGFRVFNGRDGEWLCRLDGCSKKGGAATALSMLRPQGPPPRAVALYFAPIKKARLDWLVEKAVELGATALHPVLTQNAEARELNMERTKTRIIEAAEQCERLDIPALHPAIKLAAIPQNIRILACIERSNAETPPLIDAIPPDGDIALLIGPEGGFSGDEIAALLCSKNVIPVTLGPRILRAETAACAALAVCGYNSA